MQRRKFLYGFAGLSLTSPFAAKAMNAPAGWLLARTAAKDHGTAARPTPRQVAWQNLEFGMFVHLAPNTWQNLQGDNLSTPLSDIDPVDLNTDQWVETALSMGARYVVFVAKHQGGFCMWQTHTTPYSIRNTPWQNGKGDVMRDISESCRKHGLPLGVYVSPRDQYYGAGIGGKCKTPELQKKYNAIYREQLTEVFSRYGELVEIWFDGSTVTPVGDLIHRYQPAAMIFQGPNATIRWVGNENGFAPYPCWNGIDRQDAKTGTATALNSDPNGSVWMPVEADVSIRRPDWFWTTTNADKVLTLDQLLSIYYRSVGRGAQLLLNIPPNTKGLMARPDCEAARQLGDELRRRFNHPVASTHGAGHLVELKLEKPTRIDTVILQEQISGGERVRAYQLDGRENGIWKSLGNGSAIGHKRIQPVPPHLVDAVRLRVTQSVGDPWIRTLAIFDTGVAPPADWDAVSHLWAANLVGHWSEGTFSLDLSSRIHAAAQYVLRFQAERGTVTGFHDVVLEVGGVPAPDLLKHSPTHPEELILDITGLDASIRIHGKVDGATNGSILFERVQ
jgi:alpha-L-fucosidase